MLDPSFSSQTGGITHDPRLVVNYNLGITQKRVIVFFIEYYIGVRVTCR
jgi:hypothetical protein